MVVASGKGPKKFSLACLGFFLSLGVSGGTFLFSERECSEIVKADELLISARALRSSSRSPLADLRLNERIGD